VICDVLHSVHCTYGQQGFCFVTLSRCALFVYRLLASHGLAGPVLGPAQALAVCAFGHVVAQGHTVSLVLSCVRYYVLPCLLPAACPRGHVRHPPAASQPQNDSGVATGADAVVDDALEPVRRFMRIILEMEHPPPQLSTQQVNVHLNQRLSWPLPLLHVTCESRAHTSLACVLT
jgi:hypothetical protein